MYEDEKRDKKESNKGNEVMGDKNGERERHKYN